MTTSDHHTSPPSELRRAAGRVLDAAFETTIAPSWSRVGIAARRTVEVWQPPGRLDGRVVVLTGFTSGIGRAAASELGRLGATLHLVGRSAGKVRDQAAALRAEGAQATTSVADMGDLEAVARLATEITETHDRVDVLVHNAGALSRERTTSPQGVETTVAVQVLGPFALTARLLPALDRSGGDARVLTMSSGGMYAERLDVDELEMTSDDYDGVRAYARAKRAQVELTAAWAARHPRVGFHALHPGWVDTPGVVASLPRFHRLTRLVLRSPDEGADTLVWLAGADRSELGASGGFWLDRHRRSTSKVPWTRPPAGELDRLWSWCVRRTGLAPH